MVDKSSEVIRHLIRLANGHNLDPQSRGKISDIATHVRDLQQVSQKIRDLDIKLKEFKCAHNLSE